MLFTTWQLNSDIKFSKYLFKIKRIKFIYNWPLTIATTKIEKHSKRFSRFFVSNLFIHFIQRGLF